MRSHDARPPHARLPLERRGFTLLEVILALAILGLALATFGQAVGWSHDNARRAARQTDLTLAASSVLDELLSGARELVAVDRVAYEDASAGVAGTPTLVTIGIESGPLNGLLVVRVRVEPNDPAATPRDAVTITRWLVDPSLAGDAAANDEGAAL